MSVTTPKIKLRGPAEWGDCPESMQKAERRPGETAAVRDRGGAGNPARRLGLATDGEMPIGAAAPMSRAPQSLAAQAAWNSRAS